MNKRMREFIAESAAKDNEELYRVNWSNETEEFRESWRAVVDSVIKSITNNKMKIVSIDTNTIGIPSDLIKRVSSDYSSYCKYLGLPVTDANMLAEILKKISDS